MVDMISSWLCWYVFVTSRVIDGEGSIVQTLIIKYNDEDLHEYEQKLLLRAKETCGVAVHDPELIERGYLLDEDFPEWVPINIRNTLKSRYQLFSTHERKIKVRHPLFDDVEYCTIAPVHAIKSPFQSTYNSGKWGLDKRPEFALSVLPIGVPMETKYLFRGLAGSLVSLWRTEQSIKLVVPFLCIYREENDGKDPSISQIRSHPRELSWDDFVYEFSYDCLKELQRLENQHFLILCCHPLPAPQSIC